MASAIPVTAHAMMLASHIHSARQKGMARNTATIGTAALANTDVTNHTCAGLRGRSERIRYNPVITSAGNTMAATTAMTIRRRARLAQSRTLSTFTAAGAFSSASLGHRDYVAALRLHSLEHCNTISPQHPGGDEGRQNDHIEKVKDKLSAMHSMTPSFAQPVALTVESVLQSRCSKARRDR